MHRPELAAVWEPRLTGTDYDVGLRDPAGKRRVLAGMGMTEKQGGSDVRDATLMLNVLADLAAESEAATTLAMRLAAAVDDGETELSRLAVAVGKVLGVQAGRADGRRGPGVPRRQGLHRGGTAWPACTARRR